MARQGKARQTNDSNYKKNVEKLVQKHKLRIRVVERAGQTVKQVLQRSDPFQKMKCEREDCFICRNDIPINCRERGVCYQLQCSICELRLYSCLLYTSPSPRD